MTKSIHVTLKEAPNPNPLATLGLFENPEKIPNITELLQAVLSTYTFKPTDVEYKQNLREEVIKAVTNSEIQAVMRNQRGQLIVVMKENK